MLPAEQNYKIHNKELLVVVVAFKQQKIYLEGVKYTIIVYSDYQNLQYFISIKKLNQ